MNTNEPCAAVFPVDEDFMRLPNNDVIQLEGRQQKITYYLTLGGWNISSPNHIINVIDKFDFSQLDVLVLVNSYHFLEHRVIEDIIRIAAQNNIEIYWARDDRDVDRQAIEEMSDELKVCTSFICNEVAADISTVLHNFDIPIVSIAGVGPYVQKFQVGLKLRNDFVSAGYKTLYISSRREGVLFGARIFPEFLFENGMSFSEKIYGINHYIEKLCREEQPDVVLISVPGETMELSQKHKLDFGYLASIVFSAIKPDVSILNLYNLKYTDEFLEEQKSYCKYRFGAVPDLFYATYTGIVESSLQEAWIGRNGSGKTTIINLLTRLYEPENGQILLNGTNIADMSLQAYREMVSIVSQQIYLFNDSIRNNICLYKQVSDAMLKIACRDSGLEDFIKEVSLDYVVGQNGAMLSGGQKQKIALARALIHDKPIIIFDEATSNTDAYSEQQINALLHTGLRDKTVIVITHKKEVLSEVDQIVVLDDGKIDIVGGYEAVKKSKYWLQLRDDYVDI